MKKKSCACTDVKRCKSCYDKERHSKIKQGTWEFNGPLPDKLTSEQEQVLIGGLLGDAHIYAYHHHKTNGIAIGRQKSDLPYLEYQYSFFKDFCSVGIKERSYFDKRTNKTYYGSYLRTRCAEVFVPYRNKWYPKGIKIVPKDLKLTPLICAIWFCDDGSIVRNTENYFQLSLYTDGFTKKEVEFLSSLLEKEVGGLFNVQEKKGKKVSYYLRMNKEAAVNFIKYISPVFPESMKRKSDRWKDWIKNVSLV